MVNYFALPFAKTSCSCKVYQTKLSCIDRESREGHFVLSTVAPATAIARFKVSRSYPAIDQQIFSSKRVEVSQLVMLGDMLKQCRDFFSLSLLRISATEGLFSAIS